METTDNNVDFPTLGKPTKPTSANIFNSNFKSFSSPGKPFSQICGAVIRALANEAFPRPPLPPNATTTSSLSFVK